MGQRLVFHSKGLVNGKQLKHRSSRHIIPLWERACSRKRFVSRHQW
ncbi:hypothetical protein PG5_47030 [Pseudomonas sp. G5(2012)]|nr:hypothetical protein PG5_47030 [Pseudomonas sp. G5(2012)]